MAQPLLERAERRAQAGADGEMEGTSSAQAQRMLVRESRSRPKLQPRDRNDGKAVRGEPCEVARASARWAAPICPVRSLIDRAEENSVATQSLTARSSTGCCPSQCCIRPVSASLVKTATSGEASR